MKGTKEIISFLKNLNHDNQIKWDHIINESQKDYYLINEVKDLSIFRYRNRLKTRFKQNKLHHFAFYDQVTHLKNNHYLNQDITFLIHYSIPFALVFIKFIEFQMINDNYGYQFGDQLLKKNAARIKVGMQNDYDFELYRYNRDEFIMIFPYMTKIKVTNLVIQQLLSILSKPKDKILPRIAVLFYPKDSRNKNTLLRYSTICLEQIKNNPPMQYGYFNKKYYQQLIEEQRIEAYIKDMILKKDIHLRYQPIYRIKNKKIMAFEVLFYDDDYGVNKIFNIALKSSLIISLEKKIIEKVFEVIYQHQKTLSKEIRFSINLTPKTIEYFNVFDFIKELLIKYQVDGKQIAIEITEQYYITNERKVNHLINQLQTLGIIVYLDDFGMGFSSISHLTTLNYQAIKLDRCLIKDLFANEKSRFFVNNMIQFSKEIKKQLIIEGVETREQFEYLAHNDTVYIQGYYLSRPINLIKAIQLFKKE